MIKELQSAIVARAKTTNDFNTAISSKFYYNQAPTDTTGKYAVLSDISNPVSRDSGSLYEDCFFQVALYHANDVTEDVGSSAGVHDLFQKCVDLFDDCESVLTVTNYEVVHFTRLNIVGPYRVEGGWVIIVNYLTVLQKDR
jgi:hypothetical protein